MDRMRRMEAEGLLLGGRVCCRQARLAGNQLVQVHHHAQGLCQSCKGVLGMLAWSNTGGQHRGTCHETRAALKALGARQP